MPRIPTLLAALCLGALLLTTAAPAGALPLEDYAPYQPQTQCRPKAKPGTLVLARWIVRKHGGGHGPISRPCASGGVSEHKEGRAFDWMLDATRKRDRQRAARFLERVFGGREGGEQHRLARRMGIMYIIWNDHIYRSYAGFAKDDYLSSGCRRLRRCSRTLRHRDHMHISLIRAGGRARTSWYLARLAD